jgi:hypothetical protein
MAQSFEAFSGSLPNRSRWFNVDYFLLDACIIIAEETDDEGLIGSIKSILNSDTVTPDLRALEALVDYQPECLGMTLLLAMDLAAEFSGTSTIALSEEA